MEIYVRCTCDGVWLREIRIHPGQDGFSTWSGNFGKSNLPVLFSPAEMSGAVSTEADRARLRTAATPIQVLIHRRLRSIRMRDLDSYHKGNGCCLLKKPSFTSVRVKCRPKTCPPGELGYAEQ